MRNFLAVSFALVALLDSFPVFAANYFNTALTLTLRYEVPFSDVPRIVSTPINVVLSISKTDNAFCGIQLSDETVISCIANLERVTFDEKDFFSRRLTLKPEQMKLLLQQFKLDSSVIENFRYEEVHQSTNGTWSEAESLIAIFNQAALTPSSQGFPIHQPQDLNASKLVLQYKSKALKTIDGLNAYTLETSVNP